MVVTYQNLRLTLQSYACLCNHMHTYSEISHTEFSGMYFKVRSNRGTEGEGATFGMPPQELGGLGPALTAKGYLYKCSIIEFAVIPKLI